MCGESWAQVANKSDYQLAAAADVDVRKTLGTKLRVIPRCQRRLVLMEMGVSGLGKSRRLVPQTEASDCFFCTDSGAGMSANFDSTRALLDAFRKTCPGLRVL